MEHVGSTAEFLSKPKPALSILVMHILRKAHQIPDREHRAVVKHRPAAHPSEDLVLVAHDDFGVDLGRAVQHGDKIHLKPAVAGCEFPGLHVAVSGDVEGHVVQLVAYTVVEERSYPRIRNRY